MGYRHFLVLDSNVWVYTTRLLSTALGAAAIYTLHQTGRTLALPEVIEEEIRKHTIKRGNEAIKAIQESYFLIEQLMGARDDYRIPSKDELSDRLDTRLKELGKLIFRTEFTLDHAKGALRRVFEESPPNRYKDQQFKDSAIWEAVLDLARLGDVDFVTEDKAFFKDRKPHQGLADNLAKESEQAPSSIRVFYELGSYLEGVKEEIPALKHEEIASKIDEVIRPDLEKKAVDKGYELGDVRGFKISAYLTEKANIIAVQFELAYQARGVILPVTEEQVEAVQVVNGDCTYQLADRIASQVQFDKISLVGTSGERLPGHGEIFVQVGGVVIGRRTIPYTLREPLPE